MGASAGPPPDYKGATEDAARANKDAINQQTLANRPNINTPFGQQQWKQNPDGSWNMSNGFTGLLGNASNSLESQFANGVAQPFDNGTAAREQAINSAWDSARSRLDPMFAQQGEALQSQLLNQGLTPDSEASNSAMGNFARDKNDAYAQAMANAIRQGTEAQNMTFNQNMQARLAPLQALSGLQGLLATPNFNAAGSYQGPDYLGAANALGQFNAQDAAAQNQLWGGLLGAAGSLGGAAIGKWG